MAYDVNKVIDVANNEVGYLEKETNKNLDSKTANAGDMNYTKYWRDIYPSYQRNAWCLCFVDWCFKEAYGDADAKKLLCMTSGYTFYTPTSANYFKKNGQWHTKPQVGDLIFFKNNIRICHVGLVYKVTATTVYTIEGNTSGASGVIANGGGVCRKSYALGYSRIAGYGRPNYGGTSISTGTSSSKGYLSKGDTGSKVKELQQNLIKLGFSCGSYGADGDFGASTESAVKKFQQKYGLTVDGLAGSTTMSKINELLNAQYANKTPPTPTTNTTNKPKQSYYTGTYPALPPRGYYKLGDGYQTLTNYTIQIKRVQMYLNWAVNAGLTADGDYGQNTKNAVIKFQKTYGLTQDGLWGKDCLNKAKTVKK